ncbi:5-oxoprolinase subunit PxpB [Lentibacillus sp. L22]|uniref:5-oxoprolinase subunit PxpB n=1 Tax=Lentibacillus TaxID=175304 RepID=UPI0022B19A18|nr:5-oxoprolinase subunit PxpB [Lentibacillus daqui]
MGNVTIKPVGDTSLKVEFHETVSPELNRKIRTFCQKLQELSLTAVEEWVPAFDSVTVYYQPTHMTYESIRKQLQQIVLTGKDDITLTSRYIYVPVLYGGKQGPDLTRVASHNRLTENEVIAIHQRNEYLVYMLGFLPGFPYLGGMDKRIATPRLDEPRKRIDAGAVGIAHEQTGIYPLASPGGWNIIGKTPLQLFQSDKENDAFLFQAGDVVCFYEITAEAFAEIELLVKEGSFRVNEKFKQR